MIDIVKKLRNGEPADSQYSNDLMREAADKIELLREALEEIDHYPEHCRSIARAALQKDKGE